MEVKAKLRHLRRSPRKVRLVVDLVRGLPVKRALEQLDFSRKGASVPVKKLIESAIANAKNNFKLNINGLYIKVITVDQGPTLKRWRARAHGRAGRILKRTSHITVILDEKELTGDEKIIKLKEKVEKKSDETKNKDDKIKGSRVKDKIVNKEQKIEHKDKPVVNQWKAKKRSQTQETNKDKRNLANKKQVQRVQKKG